VGAKAKRKVKLSIFLQLHSFWITAVLRFILTGKWHRLYWRGKNALLTCFLANAESEAVAFLFFLSDTELTSFGRKNVVIRSTLIVAYMCPF
jgi:hypothetical protein